MLDLRNSYFHPQPPPFDHLDRGPPGQANAAYGAVSLFLLPPPRTLAVSVIVVAAALADPAPAAAFLDELVPVPAEIDS